jgi:hypothetical protein
MKYLKTIMFSGIILILALSCSLGPNDSVVTLKEFPEKMDMDQILNELRQRGFDTSDYVIDEEDNSIIVEGDIGFDLNELYTDSMITRHYRYKYVTNRTTIRIAVRREVHANWQRAISRAISTWNSIPGSPLTFLWVTGDHHIIIKNFNSPSDFAIADSKFPTRSGKPGYRIRINTDFNSNATYPFENKVRTMIHEIGHCIGLEHTDRSFQYDPTFITGTPEDDPSSIMHSTDPEVFVPGYFTPGDIYAIHRLFPPRGDFVRLYNDVYYGGNYINIPEGENISRAQLDRMDMRIVNSFRVSGDAHFLLYEDAGGYRYYDHSVPAIFINVVQVDWDGPDNALHGSFAVAYTQREHQGYTILICNDDIPSLEHPYNNSISSIKVVNALGYPTVDIQAYSGADFAGLFFDITGDIRDLRNIHITDYLTFDDRISSFRVRSFYH